MSDQKFDPIDDAVTEAQTGKSTRERMHEAPPDERRRNHRGRTGVSRGKSPRPGVRDPGKPHEGEFGEKAYGTPTKRPEVQQQESEKRKKAKPDPLKPKKK